MRLLALRHGGHAPRFVKTGGNGTGRQVGQQTLRHRRHLRRNPPDGNLIRTPVLLTPGFTTVTVPPPRLHRASKTPAAITAIVPNATALVQQNHQQGAPSGHTIRKRQRNLAMPGYAGQTDLVPAAVADRAVSPSPDYP